MLSHDTYETYYSQVPARHIDRLKERIEHLSNKAVKLGMPPFTLNISDSVYRKVPDRPGQYARFHDVTLTGGTPILSGWRFVAKIEHDDTMNMVNGFGAQSLIDQQPDLFERLTNCPPNCEHCGVNRKRNITFLFAKTDDPTKHIQVGSSCVADFSGHKDPSLLLSLATIWQTVTNELSDPDYLADGAYSDPVFDLKTVVAAAAGVIRKEGRWVSRDDADPLLLATADTVNYLLSKPTAYNKIVSAGDERNAQAVVDWLSGDNFDHQGQVYLSNLKALSVRKYISPKHIGLAASAFIAHKRYIDRESARIKDRESHSNIRLGEPGERLELHVSVEKIIPIDTRFGVTKLHLMRDLDSNARITWFNSGARKFHEGDNYTIKGRVKDHNSRDGLWQTQLTRVSSSDIKIQDDLIAQSQSNVSPTDTFIAKMQKQIATADNPNCRNGRGYTVAFASSYLFATHGDTYLPLIEASLNAGHDLSIPCPDEHLNAFDYLVMSESPDLVAHALKDNPELASEWDSDKLHQYGIESKDVIVLLSEARGETSPAEAVALNMA